jgi:hypothetical protein
VFGLGAFAKLAKGGIGPEQFGAICEAAGIDVEFSEVTRADYRATFGAAGTSLTRPGSRLLNIRGKMKNGDTMDALIILVPR